MSSRILVVLLLLLACAVLLLAQAPPSAPTDVKSLKRHTTSSGLEYWDIAVGTGAEVKAGDKVSVNYTGWLTSGKLFDSSIGKQPFPLTVGVGQVIRGWDEGLVGMKAGGKRQLRIPPNLAYGDRGVPGVIPPNSTLVFDVDVLTVNAKK